MSPPRTVIGYVLHWKALGEHLGFYWERGRFRHLSFRDAKRFKTEAEADSVAFLEATADPNLIGYMTVRPIIQAAAIHVRRSIKGGVSEGYLSSGGGLVSTLDEAAKYASVAIADQIAFTMAVADPSLMGNITVEELQVIG